MKCTLCNTDIPEKAPEAFTIPHYTDKTRLTITAKKHIPCLACSRKLARLEYILGMDNQNELR